MHFDIAVGSVLGASEYVAEALQAHINSKGHDADCHFQPVFSELTTSSILLICTSTHGAGDLPDNFVTFSKQLEQADLSNKSCLIVGLGDSSYDTYCGAAEKVESIIKNKGAKLLVPALHIDVLNHPIPENIAVEWLSQQDIDSFD